MMFRCVLAGRCKLVICTVLYLLSFSFAYRDYPVPPDRFSCTKELGRPFSRWRCQNAVDSMPRGSLASVFTTRSSSPKNNWIHVPKRYGDGDRADHGCTVTIDLDGNSNKDVFVMVPWDDIHEMAQIVMDSCVNYLGSGGFITYGLGRTLEAMTGPVMYDVNGARIAAPGYVEQPDGSVDAVATPYDKLAGYSKSRSFSFPHVFAYIFAIALGR